MQLLVADELPHNVVLGRNWFNLCTTGVSTSVVYLADSENECLVFAVLPYNARCSQDLSGGCFTGCGASFDNTDVVGPGANFDDANVAGPGATSNSTILSHHDCMTSSTSTFNNIESIANMLTSIETLPKHALVSMLKSHAVSIPSASTLNEY
ncbi:hypothetical protein B0H34DRAFT_822847 [Crassisporium funariophilum]|nr:hypothetical protein B0H34DRAFT_822847 [Crassisporium funariophilum]